ncbi:hypothetical protein HOLleu_20960 [Holothuria leucospilota]|uniref:Uncharacterized protein n=1 Tax=Holothuria leucospilota TaxID=206669 RepID=A0A9Q1BWN1_HOLLE|nr:hypothetical protein HOLleu_20960 [Holothuria leucospilota]
MQRWRKHGPYLQVRANGSPKQRQSIISGASKDLIHCLCEGAVNTLKGNVQVNRLQKKNCRKHRNTLRTLANKRVSTPSKRKLLLQRGGSFLAALLPPLIGALGSALFARR